MDDLAKPTNSNDSQVDLTNDIGKVDLNGDTVGAKLLADAQPAGSTSIGGSSKDAGFLSNIAENTWLQINGASYHFDRSKHFNEQNYGLGLMYKIAPDKAIAIGEYRNSIRNTSHYAYFDYEPLKVGPVRAGVLAGVVDGYYFRHGGAIPMALPTVSVEGKHFGVSAFYIPPMPQISSVIAVQARVKF